MSKNYDYTTQSRHGDSGMESTFCSVTIFFDTFELSYANRYTHFYTGPTKMSMPGYAPLRLGRRTCRPPHETHVSPFSIA